MMKQIVITGATSGVGEALVRHFAQKNWSVIGLARSLNKLKKLESEFPNFDGIPTDIGIYKDVVHAFNWIDSIDVLVNNAAIYMKKQLEKYDSKEIRDIIQTNLLGTIYTTKCASNRMKENGRIITISSVAGLKGIPLESIYCASKHGLEGFLKSVALELRSRKIWFTTIYPGGINTPLWNENNIYDGDVEALLTVDDIVAEVENVVNLKDNVIKEKVVLYPSNESH